MPGGLQAWAWLQVTIKLKVRERDDWKPDVFVMQGGMKESPEKIIFSPVYLRDPQHNLVRWEESREEASLKSPFFSSGPQEVDKSHTLPWAGGGEQACATLGSLLLSGRKGPTLLHPSQGSIFRWPPRPGASCCWALS